MSYNFIQGQRRSNLSPDPSKEKVNYQESLRQKLTMDPKAMFLSEPAVSTFSQPMNDAPFLRLVWDNIANVPVANPTNVSQWNTFLGLPNYGNPFTSVVVTGNEVKLIGGSNISLGNQTYGSFYPFYNNQHLIEIHDTGCVTNIGYACFGHDAPNTSKLTTIDFSSVTSIYEYAFFNCILINYISIPSCSFLDASSGGNIFNISLNYPDSVTMIIQLKHIYEGENNIYLIRSTNNTIITAIAPPTQASSPFNIDNQVITQSGTYTYEYLVGPGYTSITTFTIKIV